MVRILLVDEQKVIREGLKVLLESESDLEIVAAVSNGYAAISQIETTNPDILFISIKLSEIEGLDITAIIRQKYPQIKIIVFSDRANEQHLIQFLEMGIKGYLLKDTPIEEMIEAIEAVAQGHTHVANGAFNVVMPQISATKAQLKTPKPEIILRDTPEYQKLPQRQTMPSSAKKRNCDPFSDRVPTSNHQPSLPKPSQPVLMKAKATGSRASFSLPSADKTKHHQGLNRYFSAISLASLGLLAISIGIISVISRRSPQVVIENALINGKTIAVNSPIEGKLTKINYYKGAPVTADSVIAIVEPLLSDRYDQATIQLQEQIELKQQQQTVAQQSLSFLENSLQNLEQESVNQSPQQLHMLLKTLHLNQIKYQEIALKTAKIREDAAQINYEDLKQLQPQNKVSETQLNSAKNSWELAKNAIEEITTNLESTREEYQLLQLQIAEGKQKENKQVIPKISRLKQQIDSQKTSLNLLQNEIGNLQNKLIAAISQAAQKQSFTIKSPIAGAIYSQKYTEGEVVEALKPVATIIDCNNLWVEATVEPQVTTKINTQEPVLVTIAEQNLSLQGKISLIESLNISQQGSYNSLEETAAIATQIPPSLKEGNYSRVIVSVPDSVEQLNNRQFCGVGQSASLSFGGDKESLVGKLQLQWLWQNFAFSI